MSFLYSSRRRVHFFILLLLVFSGLQYGSAEFAHFNLDDHQLVVMNPSIRSFHQLPTVLAAGRPMRGITLMIDYALFGLDPRGYHLHNLFWHLLGSILFYALVYRIFGRPMPAGVAAMLFALHPVHAEAVMAIAHRKDLLAFTFMMLSYHAWLYRPRARAAAPLLSLLFFILAILSKQVAMVLPLIILVHERLRSGACFKARVLWLSPLVLVAAGVIIGGVLYPVPVLRDFNLFGKMAPADLAGTGYLRILATSFSVFPRYLAHLLFPVHLTVAPMVEICNFAGPRTWLGILLFVLMPAAAFRLRRDFLVSFSLMWIFLSLLPIMNWIPANALFADRYLYIPSAGFCLLAAGLWERLYLAREEVVGPLGRRAAGQVLFAMLVFLALVSPIANRINVLWPRGGQYHMERSVALAASAGLMAVLGAAALFLLDRSRRARLLERSIWVELAAVYALFLAMLLGAMACADLLINHHLVITDLDVAARQADTFNWLRSHARPGPRSGSFPIFPYGTPLAEWSMILTFMAGGGSLAILIFRRLARRGFRTHPNRGLAVEIMGLIFLCLLTQGVLHAGDWTSELRLWRYAVMENPGSLLAWNNLGKAYFDRRRFDLASEAYEKTTRLQPDKADNYRNLAVSLMSLGDLKGAETAYARALGLSPDDIDSRNNLANIIIFQAEHYHQPAGFAKAVEHYLRILAIDSGNAHAHHNLAYCYLRMGDLNTALDEIERALSLNPRSQKSRALQDEILKARRESRQKKPPGQGKEGG